MDYKKSSIKEEIQGNCFKTDLVSFGNHIATVAYDENKGEYNFNGKMFPSLEDIRAEYFPGEINTRTLKQGVEESDLSDEGKLISPELFGSYKSVIVGVEEQLAS